MVKVLLIDPALATFRERFGARLPDEVEVVAVSSFDADEFARLALDAEIFVNARRPVDAALLAMAPDVRFIQQIGVGTDPIDLAAVESRGLLVAYNPGVNKTGAAEHVVMLMLALLKRLPDTERATRAGRFEPSEVIAAGIDDMADATVGLIGLGQIGQSVAERLVPFGPRIVYFARHAVPEAEERLGVERLAIPELLAASTIVSLHLPLSSETRDLIGAPELARMPRGSYLVNTGRGGLVDEGALREAIETGHLAGAALDVIERENEGVNPFADLPNVLVTPHIGGGSRNSMSNVVERCTANIQRYLAGEPVLDVVVASGRASA
jgi:phosphoglycerate dehydrogenase-like enzyme